MYTIFINDKPFIITDDKDYLIHDSSYKHHYSEEKVYIRKVTYSLVNDASVKGLVLHVNQLVKAFATFCSDYDIVEAAGGVVENEIEQVLLIYRKGCWDLPKGKIEAGETETVAARREVMEECGLTKVDVKNKLTVTYHTFPTMQRNVLKISHWYAMNGWSKDRLKPQVEEDITEIKWFNKTTLDPDAIDTYRSIHEVLRLYLDRK